MTARVIDGREISRQIKAELTVEVAELTKRGAIPGLGVIIVGDDPASRSYVSGKEKACQKIGINAQLIEMADDVTQDHILGQIERWNNDNLIHGILVQLPLPAHIHVPAVIHAISPQKDVDGFHPMNVGKMLIGEEDCFLPCTPAGIREMLIRSEIVIEGKHVVVAGRSNIVGKPIAAMLVQKNKGANATVTICHSRTPNLSDITRQADILIAAMGKPCFITGEMIKPGAVVIDVGINRVDDPDSSKGYRLVGDVDYDQACRVAGAISPVPGGVGPMTITMLLKNTVQSAHNFLNIQ